MIFDLVLAGDDTSKMGSDVIPKISLPEELGPAPLYEPEKKKSSFKGGSGGGGNGKKKNFSRGGFKGKPKPRS